MNIKVRSVKWKLLGSILLKARNNLGLSIREVTENSKYFDGRVISKSQLSIIERGETEPKISVIKKLSELYKLTLLEKEQIKILLSEKEENISQETGIMAIKQIMNYLENNDLGDFSNEDIEKFLESILDKYKSLASKLSAETNNFYSISYLKISHYSEAKIYAQRALDEYYKGNSIRNKDVFLNNYGVIFIEEAQRNDDKYRKLLYQLKTSKFDQKESTDVSIQINQLREFSINLYRQAEKIFLETSNVYLRGKFQLAIIYFNLGELEINAENKKDYYNKSLHFFNKFQSTDMPLYHQGRDLVKDVFLWQSIIFIKLDKNAIAMSEAILNLGGLYYKNDRLMMSKIYYFKTWCYAINLDIEAFKLYLKLSISYQPSMKQFIENAVDFSEVVGKMTLIHYNDFVNNL